MLYLAPPEPPPQPAAAEHQLKSRQHNHFSPGHETARTRDSSIVLGSLALLVALAWAYLFQLAAGMSEMQGMAEMSMSPQPQAWSISDFVFAFTMWSVMMIGMMLPAAAPMILLFSRLQGGFYHRTVLFVFGYLTAWVGYSAAAALLQGGLQELRLLADSGLTHQVIGGVVLIGAGIYQWTPLKERCLENCQSPLGFLMARWRPGSWPAVRLGLAHGAYCLGCCWMLMLLLFVGGVMNLLWAAALAMLVLLEKVVPAGPWLARGVGAALVAWGVTMLVGFGL